MGLFIAALNLTPCYWQFASRIDRRCTPDDLIGNEEIAEHTRAVVVFKITRPSHRATRGAAYVPGASPSMSVIVMSNPITKPSVGLRSAPKNGSKIDHGRRISME